MDGEACPRRKGKVVREGFGEAEAGLTTLLRKESKLVILSGFYSAVVHNVLLSWFFSYWRRRTRKEGRVVAAERDE